MRLLAFLGLLLLATHSFSQGWPSRPVRVVVPLSPGGFADAPARLLAPRLSAAFGRQFFVENRPGAGGTIGANEVAKAAPDGHTVLLTATPHVIGAHLYRNLQYDALRDFAPVSLIASGPYALVVNPEKLPVTSVRELIGIAKARPTEIDYASSGNGSAQHLVAALFGSMAGIRLNHVPYKGSGPAMQDLLAGQVALSFAGIPNVLTPVRSGKLRALAVTGARRWSELPEVPTLAEAGVAGYEATLWIGMAGPAALPAEIVQRLSSEIARLLQDADLRQTFRAAGVEASPLGPHEFGAFMRDEHAKWGRVVRETGATVN
jgi:tripartite-type tricarboxylate transporter receptor subunit TctC